MSDSEGDVDLQYYSDASDGYMRSPAISMTDVRGGDSEKEGCLKEARVITVDGAARMASLEAKKYTDARPWPYLMPFLPDAEADEWLNEVTCNLLACIRIDDTGFALEQHLDVLNRYIAHYGLRFSKEQHCNLIKTVYGLIVRPKQHAPIAHSAAAVFTNLITGSRLTRADLILDWRPIFDQFEQVILGKDQFIELAEIQTAVVAATAFFEKGAEREIWKRIRHYISPSTMSIAASFVYHCLPTTGYEKDDLEMKQGDVIDDHFLHVLWHFYEREEINNHWTDPIVGFFARLTKDSPSAVLPFFHRHLHLIFTRLIRLLDIRARPRQLLGHTVWHNKERAYQYYGKWIGYMLDTHPSVETHLMRLFSVVESRVDPSRRWTPDMAKVFISHLLVELTAVIMKRCRRALQAKLFNKESIPPISESTITAYVNALLPMIVSPLHVIRCSAAGKLLGELAFLRPGLVIPKILDQAYPSLSAHRKNYDLHSDALKRMLILIASDRADCVGYNDVRVPTKKDWLAEREEKSEFRSANKIRWDMRQKRNQLRRSQEKLDSSPEKKKARVNTEEERTDSTQSDTEAVLSLRPHLVYIAEALIECIAINITPIGIGDHNNAADAYRVFTHLFAVMPIVDCSQTTEKGPTGDCTDEEHRLIQLSKRLKDIALRFVDKSFSVFGHRASVWVVEDSFRMLFSNTDEEIGKLLCDKVLDYVKTPPPSSEAIRASSEAIRAKTISKLVMFCVYDHPVCVDSFLEFIVNEIGEVVDEDTQKAKHVDGKAAWLATIAPGFCFLQSQDVHDNFENLVEMGMRLLACKNKVMYEAGCSCLSSLLLCLLGTTPLGTRADTRYKEGRTPSKLWGVTVDGLRTTQQWTHPVKADFEAAMKILDLSLFAEMRRLAKPEAMTREELGKSLSIVFNLFSKIAEFAPAPNFDRAPIHHMRQNDLPPAQLNPKRAYQQLAAGEITFEGRNLRVALCELAEGLINCEKCNDSQALGCLVGLISTLGRIKIRKVNTMSMLHNPLLRERAMTPGAVKDMLSSVYNSELSARDTAASTFDCRVMRALFALRMAHPEPSFSLDEGIGKKARSSLCSMLAEFPDTTMRDEFIDGIEAALNNGRPEIQKGALQLLVDLGVAGSMQIQLRARVWPLLLRIRRPEDKKMRKCLDDCYDRVMKCTHWSEQVRKPYPPEYLAFVDGLLKETPRVGEWTKVGDVDALIASARKKVLERTEKTKKMYAELSATLHTALRASQAQSPTEKTMDGVRDKASISALPSDFDSAKTEPSHSTSNASSSSTAVTTDVSCKTADATSPSSTSSPSTTGAPESSTTSSSTTSMHSTPVKRTDRSPSRGGARTRQLFPLLPPPGSPFHFHPRTSDLCVKMITLVENQNASAETMKEIILPRLLDDRILERHLAINELLFWLRKNKPKTAREQWACPPKVQGSTGISYGLRPDNIMLVYDSHNLPDTEQKWNTTRFFRKTKGYFAWPSDGKISIPARSAIPVGIQMNAVDRVIVDWFANRDNVHRLIEMTLDIGDGRWCSCLKGSKAYTDYTDLPDIVRYLLRNYPDVAATRLLPPLREALELLMAGRHVYEGLSKKARKSSATLGRREYDIFEEETQRLSAELFLGIAKGTKYLPFNVLNDLWKWMAPAVIGKLDLHKYYKNHTWWEAFEKLLSKDDPRRFWWIVEALIASFDARKTIAHDDRWKPADRLYIFTYLGGRNSWRNSETLNRVLSMAFAQLAPIATPVKMRTSIAALMVKATAVATTTHYEFFGGIPERFRIRTFDDYLMELAQEAYKMSRQASPVLLAAFDPSEDKENRRHEQLSELDTTSSASSTSTSTSFSWSDGVRRADCDFLDYLEQKKEAVYARVLFETLFTFYDDDAYRPITDATFKVLPLVIELFVKSEAGEAEIDFHVDAKALVHQLAACISLDEKKAERMVDTMEMIIKQSSLPKHRATALEFLHIIVLSNIFLFDRLGGPMRSRLHAVVLEAMHDEEVCRKAADCLCAFIDGGYFELNEALESHFRTLVASGAHAAKQAGCLGFAAIIRAYPLSAKVVPALRELCRLSSGVAKDVLVQDCATSALRDFRLSHGYGTRRRPFSSEWASSTHAAAAIGADLVDLIENVVGPPTPDPSSRSNSQISMATNS